jgi:hypothetical protein
MDRALNYAVTADFLGEGAFREANDNVARLQKQMRDFERAAVGGSDNVAKAQRAARFETANIGAQFQDIAVQLQGGGSPLTVALQQGTQLGAILGQQGGGVRGALTALAAGFASVLSPVNLLTIGTIAAAGAIYQWATSGKDGTDKVNEAMKAHEDLLKRIKDQYPNLVAESGKYREALVSLGLDSRKISEQMAENSKAALDKAVQGATQVSTLLNNGMSKALKGMGEDPGFTQLRQNLDTFLESVRSGSPQVAAFEREMAKLALTSDNRIVKNAADDLNKLARDAGSANASLQGTNKAVATLNGTVSGSIGNITAYSEAMSRLGLGTVPAVTEAQKAVLDFNEAIRNSAGREQKDDAFAALEKRMNALRIAAEFPIVPGRKPNLESEPIRKTEGDRAAESEQQKYDRLIAQSQKQIAVLNAQNGAFGESRAVQEAARFEAQMLGDMESRNIKITDERRLAIERLGEGMQAAIEKQDELKKAMESMSQVKDALGSAFSAVAQAATSGGNAIDALGDSMKRIALQAADRAFMALLDMFLKPSGATGAPMNLFSAFGLPSFAVGADNIPRDMVANIHKGEMIVPADSAEAIRSAPRASGRSGGGDMNVTINNSSGSEVSTRRGSSGNPNDLIIDVVKGGAARGALDGTMGGRFGARVQTVRR